MLNQKQLEAIDRLKARQNVFITGGAGVGKSFLIDYISKNKEEIFRDKKVGVTSTTGTSSILINGTTIHSYLGLGLGNNSYENMYTFIVKRKHLRERWRELDVLIIDEISMLTADLFDKIEAIARKIRFKFHKPFGGIQLVCSGDFFQLPPIGVGNGESKFCFQSENWERCIPKENVIILSEIIRQEDKLFANALSKIRVGVIDNFVKDLFSTTVGKSLEDDIIKPTRLYPLNSSVDYINEKEFGKAVRSIDEETREYVREFEMYPLREVSAKVKENVIEKYKNFSIIPEQLELCVGCQVMLIQNLDLTSEGEQKLVNGSRGIVTRFVDDIPVVKFTNGKEIVIDWYTWEIEENDISFGRISQIPLKLAYAFSIHKSQGCTLDKVMINLRSVFEYGMGYVALSRVKNLDGLYIEDIDWTKIKAHPEVIEYFNSFE
jgi:ATP-dependent DNA helicase PIF1